MAILEAVYYFANYCNIYNIITDLYLWLTTADQ